MSEFAGIDPNGEWKLYIDSKPLAGSELKESRIDGGWMLAIHTKPQMDPIKDQEMKQNESLRIPIVVGDNQPSDIYVETFIHNPSVIQSVVATGNGGTAS